MLPNPYTPGQLPRVLAGREPQQTRIRARLSRVSTYGEFAGPPLMFHGPRGVGKTSLLRDGEQEARELGFLTAWVACSRQKPFLADLVSRVTRATDKWDAGNKNGQAKLRIKLDTITAQIGIPGANVTARAKLTSPDKDKPDNAKMSAIEDLLHETSTAIRQLGGAGLVVFIDELHTAHLDDLSVLLNALQLLEGERGANPLTVITAGLPSTPGWVTKAATFGERSEFVPLPRLDYDAAIDALIQPAAALDVTWTKNALDAVAAEADGFPYLLQVVAHATWQTAMPKPGDEINEGHVHAAHPEAQRQLDALYSARWTAAGKVERKIIRAMATHTDNEVSRADVATTVGVDTRRLSMPRERLIDKGIIEPSGHGLLRFTMPGFGQYVRDHHGHDA